MTARLMIAAGSSGSGKTTVACALQGALKRRGLRLMAFKSGPDYIDPMFHESVLGTKSRNLDLFFFSPQTARALVKKHAEHADLTVIEGAMGYYDGIAMTSEASAYALASATETPVVLVVDGRGRAISAAAEVEGFLRFKTPSQIRGVILNRVSPMLYPRLKDAIEKATGVPVLGYLPVMENCSIESRHLGLVTAAEIADLKERLGRLACQAEKSFDLDGLIALAGSAPELTDEPTQLTPLAETVRVAVAKDKAFCFYYEDSLDVLRAFGAELVKFSPLEDQTLPKDVSALYLGGGYPEIYAKQLSENVSMRESIRDALADGMPAMAECGGFMYLHRTLQDADGTKFPMVGALNAEAFPTGKLSRFGYVTLTAKKDSMLFHAGEQMPAHEFHYWDSSNPGEDFSARKPLSNRHWDAGIANETLYAGFPHFHFAAKPLLARRFLEKALEFSAQQEGKR